MVILLRRGDFLASGAKTAVSSEGVTCVNNQNPCSSATKEGAWTPNDLLSISNVPVRAALATEKRR